MKTRTTTLAVSTKIRDRGHSRTESALFAAVVTMALCLAPSLGCGGGGESVADATLDRGSSADGPVEGGQGLGEMCTETSECAAGLYCAESRTCRAAGFGGDGDTCADSGDCMRGYVCVSEPGGTVCRQAEGRAVGEPCIRHEQCAAGLYCIDGMCSTEAPPEPDGGLMGQPCTPGTDDCDDGSRCTNDQCVADRCLHTLIDGDEDGYASDLLGSCGLDCSDSDDRVNPDQTAFFEENHAGNPPLTPANHDWDCDGIEEMEHPNVLPSCTITSPNCVRMEGWVRVTPTRCGEAGVWGSCIDTGGVCRIETVEMSRVQRCR